MALAPANFLHTKCELSSNKQEDSAHFLSDSKPSKSYKMRVNFPLYILNRISLGNSNALSLITETVALVM